MKGFIKQLLRENIDKQSLLGKKFYHGTILEKVVQSKNYLFIINDFELAKSFAIEHTKELVDEFNKPYTAVVYEIIIDDKILEMTWEVDDGYGSWEYETWQESLSKVGSFIISGKDMNLNDFKKIYKQQIG